MAEDGPEESNSIDELVAAARQGDRSARETVLRTFIPLVAAASRRLRPPTDRYFDEIYSGGLRALDEAIDRYTQGSGSFAGFAQTVVRRRMVDEVRRQARSREQLVPSERPLAPSIPAAGSLSHSVEWAGMAEELRRYAAALHDHGVSLEGLVMEPRPRSRGLRQRLRKTGKGLARDPTLATVVREGKSLPVRAVAKRFHLSPHTIARWKGFLIAVPIAYMENLPYIQQFLDSLID